MPDREIYEFAIIRLVPKVERGEFLNIGVILFSKRLNYLAIKYHIDQTRLKVFSKEIDLQEIVDYLKAWDVICQGGAAGGQIGALEMHERFRWLTATRSTIIQCSEVHPGRSSDPQKVLDELMKNYVL